MRLMKTTHHLNRAGLAQPFDAEYSQLHRNTPNLSTTGKRTFSAGQTADSGWRQRHRNRATDQGFIGKVEAISCARGERSRQSMPERTNVQTAPDPARHCPNRKPRHCNRRAIPRRPGPAQNSHSLFAGVDQPPRGSAPHSRTRVSFKSRRSRGVARRDPEISSCSTAALKTKRNAAWRNPHLSEERSKIDPSEALQIPTDAREPGTARAASL